ncbi:hypothetical protein JNM87_02595 [Candidatus Saccharibacteria bacterium]|nr:hypothetical protein [Candidatus Saccharibacteria bacterium]
MAYITMVRFALDNTGESRLVRLRVLSFGPNGEAIIEKFIPPPDEIVAISTL